VTPYSAAQYTYLPLLNETSSNQQLQQYLLAHAPTLGSFLVSEWSSSSNQYNYTVIANDTTVHALPIMFNLMSNVQLNINNNSTNNVPTKTITVTNQPLGAPAVSFEASRYICLFVCLRSHMKR
jgi:hypothetical protein